MKRKPGKVLKLILAGWISMLGQSVDALEGSDQPTKIPPGARIYLIQDKEEYFLGENIFFHYCVVNTGKEVFSASDGVAFRRGTRAFRFVVTAVGADGRTAPDPDPYQIDLSVMPDAEPLKQNEARYSHVFPMRYCRIVEPGNYAITVYHDLGWGNKIDNDVRTVSTTVKLKKPSEGEAQRVVAEMYASLQYDGLSQGEKSLPGADFKCLNYPIYLPILMKHASKGSMEAVDGIASMRTHEATDALLNLLAESQDLTFSVKLAELVTRRMPLPEAERSDENKYSGPMHLTEEFLRQVWRPEFSLRARDAAINLLASHEPATRYAGVLLMHRVAEKKDLPRLIEALDFAVKETGTPLHRYYRYSGPQGMWKELRTTCLLLMRREDAPKSPRTAGEKILFLNWLYHDEGFRPADWEETCAALLADPLPMLRAEAIGALPTPLPARFDIHVERLLSDVESVVRERACARVAREKKQLWRASVLKCLFIGAEEDLLESATSAALALDARWEVADFWLELMDDKKLRHIAFGHVAQSVTGETFSGSVDTSLTDEMLGEYKERWRKFLNMHLTALMEGKLFKPGDVELTEDLIPLGFRKRRNGLPPWPERK